MVAAVGLPVAFVRKTRISGTVVATDELVGDVRDRHAIIVDDVISTGGTVEAAARLLAGHGARPDLKANADRLESARHRTDQ